MSRTLAAALLATALSGSLPALAQTAAPAAPSAPLPPGVTEIDRQFMILDAQGGAYELMMATVAQQKSTRADIKAYASMLIQDHSEYNAALQQLAQSKGIVLPTAMSAKQLSDIDAMNRQSSGTFDNSFIAEATRINEEDRKDAQTEAAVTQDPDIKAFLQRFAAMDSRHEQAAKALSR